MRNRNRLIKDSIFRKRGFYLALYSTIGIIMLGAVGITYSAIISLEKSKNKVAEVDFNKMQNTIKDNTKSYKEKDINNSNENKKINNSNIEKENNKVQKQENTFTDNSNEENFKKELLEQENNIIKEKIDKKQKINTNKEVKTNDKADIEEKSTKENEINSFGEEDEMQWPVKGKILMEYSIDKVIYDSTLDQFRTNDNIKISAEVGEEVKASADGKIKSISKTREDGNIITIDHGDGWMTTYSQLNDDIEVSEGSKVSKDDTIGYVGKPTIYNSALGSHICFKVTKEGKTIDPNMILEE